MGETNLYGNGYIILSYHQNNKDSHSNLALTEVTRPDGRRLSLDYDDGGRLTTVTQHAATGPTGATTYDYEPADGRLAAITAPDGNALYYTYDGPLPLSERWQGEVNGATARLFDQNFWVTERTVNGTDPVAFQYDHNGLLTQAGDLALTRAPQSGLTTTTDQGAVATQRGYNAFGELASERVEVDGAALIETTYSRDLLGRITEKSETLEGVTSTERYRYDAAGRLVEVDRDGVVTSYDYDANGNRLARDGPDGLESGEYDAQDRLVAYNGDTYTYTINGELRTVGSPSGEQTTYDYDLHGNLLAVELPGGSRIDYLVDGRNRRIGKKVDGVLVQGFLYKDPLNPIAELDAEGNVVARFVYGDKGNVPAYMVKGGVTYRILSDHLGSPRLVIDTETGAVVQRMTYDAFGRVTTDTNPGFQPFGFAGGLWDRDSGLVRFGARNYDPGTGRWTGKDPIGFEGGDINLYGYVVNNPINFIDSTGWCRDDYWDRYMKYLDDHLVKLSPGEVAALTGLGPIPKAWIGKRPALGSKNPLTSVPRALKVPGGRTIGRLATPVAAVAGVGVGVYNSATLIVGLIRAF